MIIYYQLATLSSALHLLDTYSWFAHIAVLTAQYHTIIQKAKVKAASLLYLGCVDCPDGARMFTAALA